MNNGPYGAVIPAALQNGRIMSDTNRTLASLSTCNNNHTLKRVVVIAKKSTAKSLISRCLWCARQGSNLRPIESEYVVPYNPSRVLVSCNAREPAWYKDLWRFVCYLVPLRIIKYLLRFSSPISKLLARAPIKSVQQLIYKRCFEGVP